MSGNATAFSINGNFSWGFSAKKDKDKDDDTKTKRSSSQVTESTLAPEEGTEEEKTSTLGKFMTLKDIKLQVNRGELLIVIGDVGSGKSSLLNAIIGDMIYVPESEIEEFGGLDKQGDRS